MGTNLENSLTLFIPELTLLVGLILLFMMDAFVPKSRGTWMFPMLTGLVCAVGAYLTIMMSDSVGPFFSNLVVSDGFSYFFRLFMFFACAVTSVVAYRSNEIKAHGRSEFFLLLLCTTFGLSLMAISTHLLALYLAIETVSIVSFVMAGFTRNDLRSNEASLKYLVFGAASSGLMIYGISLIYGLTGSLQYADVGKALVALAPQQPLLVGTSLLFVYGGLAYKISAFPFHFWTPDVYEGSPTPVATFFSVAPKAAGFAAFMRLFLQILTVKSGTGAAAVWTPIEGVPAVTFIAFISAATMIVGNLSALGQTSVKRILAYSSIAHVGYMLMGFVTLNGAGISAILFYLIVYCLMNVGAFWVAGVVHDTHGSDNLDAFRGMGWSTPVLGTCLAIFLFSLTGIPLFSGFVGKFLLFGAVINAKGFLWLALLGVLNSVASLFYYAKILKAVWLDPPRHTQEIALPAYHAVGLLALAIPTIVFGLFFSPLIRFVEMTLKNFL